MTAAAVVAALAILVSILAAWAVRLITGPWIKEKPL